MTNELLAAFRALHKSHREIVLDRVGVKIPHHEGESQADFSLKAVRHICSEGLVRELEQEMLEFQ